VISVPRFELRESAPLFDRLGKPLQSDQALTMEAAGQAYGFILYRKRLGRAAKGTLEIAGLHDYGLVYQGARRLGTLDRRLHESKLESDLNAEEPLDILVENMGRVNFGPQLVNDRKGITGKVMLDSAELTGWEVFPLPLTDPQKWPFTSQPALYRGTFPLSATGDTFLDMRGWGKGIVWVNGHHLGRYWRIGPQQSLFVPAPWLKLGANEVIVLDLEDGGRRSLEGLPEAVYQTAAL